MEQKAFWYPGVLALVLALAACASPPVEGEVR